MRCAPPWQACEAKSSSIARSFACNVCPALVQHDRADRLALLHQVEAFIDAFERQTVRDQIVDVDLAFHVPVDDLRYVGAATCAAERRTLPFAARHELERTRADFFARCRHADDERLAPALV